MRRWWLVIVLLLSLGVNVGLVIGHALRGRGATDAAAADPASPASDPLPRRVFHLADELGLGGEKRDAFIANQRTFFEQTLCARGRMERLRRELHHGVAAEDPDREALDALLVELSEAHYDLERALVTNIVDTRQLLDEQQGKRFKRFLRHMWQDRTEGERRFRERWQRLGERWGRRDPGPRPGRRGPERRGPERHGPQRHGPERTAPDEPPPPEPPENGAATDRQTSREDP